MNIAVTVCRPWTIVHRYRSLLENAKRLHHNVLCIGPKLGGGREQLTTEILAKMDIKLRYPVDVEKTLDEFQPHIVFGETINEPFEFVAQKWAEYNAVGAVLDHSLFIGPPGSQNWIDRMKDLPESILMVTHKEREQECLDAGIKAVAIGAPELDLIRPYPKEPFCDKPTIALFIGLWWFDQRHLQDEERSVLKPFFETANEEGWQVLIHTHGGERVVSNSDGSEGLTFPERYEYLLELQEWGGQFVGEYAGRIGNLVFWPLDGFELMARSDCIVGTTLSVWWKAAALRRQYLLLTTDKIKAYFDSVGKYTIPMYNVSIEYAPFEYIRTVIDDDNSLIDDEYINRFFMGLDGKCWERMLEIAHCRD